MRTKWDDLVADFPKVFRPLVHAEGPQHCFAMFGFECGPGWAQILRTFAEKVQDDFQKYDIQVLQIKEKFGGLRIYLTHETELVEKAISEACREAEETCELCGKKGTINEDGYWLMCRCEGCK